MKTYQDLVAASQTEQERKDFILQAIQDHTSSELYKTAVDADLYYKHQNPTIMRAQKFLYNVLGQRVPDIWSANHKIPSNYYFYFVTQLVQFLLGNGVSFDDEKNKNKLGDDFDNVIQQLATNAINGGVAFGFWNDDHVEAFSVTEFVPLWDEENGALRAGIRWWRIDDSKPLRATLYEEDGVTEYIRRETEFEIIQEKHAYVRNRLDSPATGFIGEFDVQIADGEASPRFPIVPLWNINHQSAIVGGREIIDSYDLMASALVNNVDNANMIYWIIKGAGAMDDMDDQKFLERLKTMGVMHVEDGQEVEHHEINVPFQASETALVRLRSQMFDDFMAFDPKEIASGATTATQIKAAYEPLNSKADKFEYEVTHFIQGILLLAGIDDDPTYTRSMIVNMSETIQNVVTAAEYLSDDYVTKKILETLGDIDKAEQVLSDRLLDDVSRYDNTPQEETDEQQAQE